MKKSNKESVNTQETTNSNEVAFLKLGIMGAFNDSGKSTLFFQLMVELRKLMKDNAKSTIPIKGVQIESVDDYLRTEGAKQYNSHDVLLALDWVEAEECDLFCDFGSSTKVTIEDAVENGGFVDMSMFTNIIYPITGQSERELRKATLHIESLIDLGVDPESIIMVYNKLSMQQDQSFDTVFGRLNESLAEMGVNVENPIKIRTNGLYPYLQRKGLSVSDVVNTDTDFNSLLKSTRGVDRKSIVEARTMSKLAAHNQTILNTIISRMA